MIRRLGPEVERSPCGVWPLSKWFFGGTEEARLLSLGFGGRMIGFRG